MITAQPKQWQDFSKVHEEVKEHKINKKPKKKYNYGFHKFCSMVLCSAFVLGILLLAEHALVITMGYKIVSLNKEINKINTQNDRLELEIAKLKSLSRVEYLALTKLGMVKPSESETEFIDLAAVSKSVSNANVANVTVQQLPGKQVHPFMKELDTLVQKWVSDAATLTNPKG